MKKLSLFFTFVLSLFASDYRMGNGYDLLDQLRIGGYISAEYKQGKDLDEFEVDDIAIMGYGNLSHNFSYLVEFEAVKYYVNDLKEKKEEYNREFYTERAYLNYKVGNHLELTAGKFITPGCYWNQVPINVLRDLTSKPRLTQNIFPRLITGIGANGYVPGSDSLQYALFAQDNEDLDHGYNNFATDNHMGAGFTQEFEDFQIGVWGGHFHVEDGTASDYAGATFKLEQGNTKVLIEGASSRIHYETTNLDETRDAFFAQVSQRIVRKHNLAARYETYRESLSKLDEEIAIFGYNYRPIFPISLKAEYQFHDDSEKDMALFSFSILF